MDNEEIVTFVLLFRVKGFRSYPGGIEFQPVHMHRQRRERVWGKRTASYRITQIKIKGPVTVRLATVI